MATFALGYVSNSLVTLIQFFQMIWLLITTKYNKRLLDLKCYLFDNRIITHGFYDKEEKCYMLIYDYDNLYTLMYLFLCKYFLNRCEFTMPVFGNTPRDLASDRFIFVGSYLKNKKQYYAILDEDNGKMFDPTKEVNIGFVYCIVDEKYDLTHLFEKYKSSLILNQTILCEDILAILILLSKRKEWIENAQLDQLKIMMDDKFEELVFKAKDKLIINP